MLWLLHGGQVCPNNASLARSFIPWLPPECREPCLLPGRPQFPSYAKKLCKHLHLDQQVRTQDKDKAIQVQEEVKGCLFLGSQSEKGLSKYKIKLR